jgi:hypothetical protein
LFYGALKEYFLNKDIVDGSLNTQSQHALPYAPSIRGHCDNACQATMMCAASSAASRVLGIEDKEGYILKTESMFMLHLSFFYHVVYMSLAICVPVPCSVFHTV